MMKRYLGVAWYPELWPEDVWREDIRLMHQAGVNLVRVGEFAWSALEPHEGECCSDALLPAVQAAIGSGLDAVMCTPTATPPIWLSHGHPERMHVNHEGTGMSHGGRQQMCFGQASFQKHAARVTRALAQTYGTMPGIVAWQLDNELMGNVSECFCGDCLRRWALWLEKTYGTVEALNRAWGTGVWSQWYERFEQVPAPAMTPAGQSPSLVTAYRRFQQDEAAAFIGGQAAILRAHSDKPVTLNSSLNHYIDHPDTFKRLDFAAFDHYSHSTEPHRMRFFMDVFKTLKPDQPWWVMETAPSYCGNWWGHMPMHQPGYLAAEAVQAWAMGAQTFSLWLWRQQRSGSEMAHGSVLQSWGTPTPGFGEVRRTADMLAKLTPVLDVTRPVPAEVALMWSDRARAFFRTERLEEGCADYAQNLGTWHQLLFEAGIHVDGVFPDNALDNCSVLFTPCLPDIPDKVLRNGRRLLERGGTWVCGPLSGIRTKEQTVPGGHALGAFGEAFALPEMILVPLTGSGTRGRAMEMEAGLGWFSALAMPDGAGNVWRTLGCTVGGPVPDRVFLLERRVGQGRLVVLGAMPTGEGATAMLLRLIGDVTAPGGAMPGNLPEGVTAIPRVMSESGEKVWLLVNVAPDPCRWRAPWPFHDLLSGRVHGMGDEICLDAFDVFVVAPSL